MTFEDFQANETITEAVLYHYIIIGEATRNIPADIQSRYPHIPWHMMGDMRNVMVHEYFQVDPDIVWDGVNNDLPLLVPQLEELLEQEVQQE